MKQSKQGEKDTKSLELEKEKENGGTGKEKERGIKMLPFGRWGREEATTLNVWEGGTQK